ncbi:MAG: phosphatase PAP2 family protein [Ignavibacteriota bacterium]
MIYKSIILLYVLILSSVCNVSLAQKSDSFDSTNCSCVNLWDVVGGDFEVSFNHGVKTFVSPFHYSTKDAIIAGAVITTTALLFTVDESSRTYFHKQHSSFNDKLKDVGNFYGTIYPTLIAGGGLYAIGLFEGNDNVRVTGRMVFESVAIAGLLTTITKSVLGRHRPYTNDGSTKFEGPTFESDYLSLPSGHATVAFALSTTLANRIHNTYVSIGLYSLAGITALARVYDDKHWVSDVFLGSAIGYFVGDFISGKKNKETSCRIYPTLNGLKLVYNL